MVLKSHHFDSDNGNQGEFPEEEEEEEDSCQFKTPQMIRLEALRLWKQSFALTISTFVVSCLMNQVLTSFEPPLPFSPSLTPRQVEELLLPTQSPHLGFTLNETFSLFQSPHYSLQLTSLSLIYFYLQHDLRHLSNLHTLPPSKTSPSASSSASLVPVVSTVKAAKKLTKLKSQKSKPSSSSTSSSSSLAYSPQTVMEICQNGYLRQLCWCLLHSQFLVRALTLKVRELYPIFLSLPIACFALSPASHLPSLLCSFLRF
jgi:hypothetical protein